MRENTLSIPTRSKQPELKGMGCLCFCLEGTWLSTNVPMSLWQVTLLENNHEPENL